MFSLALFEIGWKFVCAPKKKRKVKKKLSMRKPNIEFAIRSNRESEVKDLDSLLKCAKIEES